MKDYYSNKTEAIKDAKDLLRLKTQTKRLDNCNVLLSSSNCNCGETPAYEVSTIGAKGHGKIFDVKVAICKHCSN